MATEQRIKTVADIMQRGVAAVAEEADLSLALQLMLWREVRHLPVTANGKLVGLLSERDLISGAGGEGSSIRALGAVRDVMQRSVATILPGASVAEAAARMSIEKIGCLPVVEGEVLVGIVTTTDVLSASAWTPVETSGSRSKVSEIMSREPVTARADDVLEDAAAKMMQRGIRHLPVVDGDERAIGIISERDVRTAFGNPFDSITDETKSGRSEATHVRHAMTENPRTIWSEASVDHAYEVMLTERFGALPVVDEEDHVVGMLSYLDLLMWSRPGSRTS